MLNATPRLLSDPSSGLARACPRDPPIRSCSRNPGTWKTQTPHGETCTHGGRTVPDGSQLPDRQNGNRAIWQSDRHPVQPDSQELSHLSTSHPCCPLLLGLLSVRGRTPPYVFQLVGWASVSGLPHSSGKHGSQQSASHRTRGSTHPVKKSQSRPSAADVWEHARGRAREEEECPPLTVLIYPRT